MNIILASASPRRRELLEGLGCRFTVITAEVDESTDEKDPGKYAEALSKKKALAVKNRLYAENGGAEIKETVIIAADTVVCINGMILGKPRDREDARRMLGLLSGKRHRVISGLTIICGTRSGTLHEITEVEFKELCARETELYLDTAEPYDKAGAYAIQGRASVFIRSISGDYFNVVGLPLHRLYTELQRLGIDLLNSAGDLKKG